MMRRRTGKEENTYQSSGRRNLSYPQTMFVLPAKLLFFKDLPPPFSPFSAMSVLLLKRATYATSIASISTAIIYHQLSPKTSTPETAGGMILPTYQATFSVPLSCGSCVSDISTALSALPGIYTFLIPPPPKTRAWHSYNIHF